MVLTKHDEETIASYEIFLEGIAAFFGDSFEYVLHRLDDLNHSVIRIINGHYSNRMVGSPITDYTLEQLNKVKSNDIIHHYMTHSSTTSDGELIRSVTIPIVGEGNRIIGMVCINFHTGAPINMLFSGYCGGSENMREGANSGYVIENFATNSRDLIREVLDEVRAQIYSNNSIRALDKNKAIILELYQRGVFNLKDAVAVVSECLGVTKNTVYLYVRENKKKEFAK